MSNAGIETQPTARPLTPREREVAALVARGLTNRQVADHLHVHAETVKKHVARILAKAGCANRTELAFRWREVDPA
jgi:DNA-binding NarL/FixJ family response regulator